MVEGDPLCLMHPNNQSKCAPRPSVWRFFIHTEKDQMNCIQAFHVGVYIFQLMQKAIGWDTRLTRDIAPAGSGNIPLTPCHVECV